MDLAGISEKILAKILEDFKALVFWILILILNLYEDPQRSS